MECEFRVYGCGSASSSRYLQSSYAFSDGETRLHLDFGYGALYQRCRAEGDINPAVDSVRYLFLSHSHPDHTSDISRLAIAWKYTPGFSPGKPVYLYGTEITLSATKAMLDCVGLESLYEEIFVPRPVAIGEPFQAGSLEGLLIPANHTKGAAGIRLKTSSGVEFAFTGDTAPYENQAVPIRDVDLLVAETSFWDNENVLHMTVDQTARLAAETHAGTLLLTHLYPDIENRPLDAIRERVSKQFDGNVFVSFDGLTLRYDETNRSWREGKLFS